MLKPTTFDFVSVDPNGSLAPSFSHHTQFTWPTPAPSIQTSNVRSQKGPGPKRVNRRLSLQPLSVPPPMASQDYSPIPMTANVLGTLGNTQFENALSLSPQTPIFQSPSDSTPISKGFPTHQWIGPYSSHYQSQPSVTSWPSETSGSLVSDTSPQDYQPDITRQLDPMQIQPLGQLVSNDVIPLIYGLDGNIKQEQEDDVEDVEELFSSGSSFDEVSKALSIQFPYNMTYMQVGNTRPLRELINYYDKVISPVIVAFDRPSNPYRTHILRLASESQALQHAIAALSASNLRMRKDYEQASSAKRLALSDSSHDTLHDASVRKSSIAHSILRDSISESEISIPGQPSHRELIHKSESIKALNASLGDVSQRHDDSVLATLLVLCLYHICDTGVAKFKTQFAGVKKILALRNKWTASRESRWLITTFRWFDAMTATVNDREGQFDEDDPLDTLLEPDDWALENLAGCDGRLFNIVSRLGRLNLLSQGKPVSGASRLRPIAARQSTNGFYNLSTTNIDGNGWSKVDPGNTASEVDGPRDQFWMEWNAVRQELNDWQFDESTIPMAMISPDPLSLDHGTDMDFSNLDLKNISESFRYSALLYTERLAHPNTPSSAPNYQALVEQAIHYIDKVKSDVYLLWPLFITGTECVLPEHRELVRQRCLSIQDDSGFFNNMSTLRILEELWRSSGEDGNNVHVDSPSGHDGFTGDNDKKGSLLNNGSGSAFRWRKAMMASAMDGEYIVI